MNASYVALATTIVLSWAFLLYVLVYECWKKRLVYDSAAYNMALASCLCLVAVFLHVFGMIQ